VVALALGKGVGRGSISLGAEALSDRDNERWRSIGSCHLPCSRPWRYLVEKLFSQAVSIARAIVLGITLSRLSVVISAADRAR
jgi:hypothetical protein